MSRQSPQWKREAFYVERNIHQREQEAQPRMPQFIKRDDGWVLFGPYDVRGGTRKHQFSLQMIHADGQPRVRVACKYMTLPQAWRHCATKGRASWCRNQYQQAIAIIRLMVLQAQAYGLPGMPKDVKFDSSITKPKRRK